MTKIFVLLCVLSLSYTASSLKLTNLCEADHFEYNGVLVNSVFFSKQSIQLEKAKFYLMSLYQNCGVSDETRATTKEFYNIKRDYNRLIVRIYSEYLNNVKNITETRLKEEANQIEQWLNKIVAIRKNLGRYQEEQCFVEAFEDPIINAKYLLKGLLPLYDRQLHDLESTYSTPYRPSRQQLFNKLDYAIAQLNREVEDGQTGAFYSEFIDDVYEKRITSFPQFEFWSDSQVTYQPDSSLYLEFDFCFPFNNEKFDNSQECVKASDLPPFFQQKGKEV